MPNRRDFLRYASIASTGAVVANTVSVTAETEAPVTAAANGAALLVASADTPQALKDAADFVCNGTNDHQIINQAIAAANPGHTGLGGVVALSQGRFNCGGPIRVRRRVSLIGSGRASILRATRSWNGGVIEAATAGTDKITIANLGIDGEYRSVHGIFLRVTEQDFDDGSPDAANYITDVYIHATGRNGLQVAGSRARATCATRVRVWDAGGHGFLLNSPDGFYHQCETGSSGGHGFVVANANNRLTNCKAWYADKNGFHITSVRNQLAACESQDNEWNGFYLGAGQVSLSACHADSNSWNSANPNSTYSGFFIKRWRSWIQLTGCQAYDKNEGSRGRWQKYGFYLEGNNSQCQISGVGRDNVNGALGDGGGLADNSIDVLGT